MPVNSDKPHLWKADIVRSVDMYNDWFMRFAPQTFRATRVQTAEDVAKTLAATNNLADITPALLRKHPGVLPTLRMTTCPPLAVDRLIGLAGLPSHLVKLMESEKKLPVKLREAELDAAAVALSFRSEPFTCYRPKRLSAPVPQALSGSCVRARPHLTAADMVGLEHTERGVAAGRRAGLRRRITQARTAGTGQCECRLNCRFGV